MKLNDKFLYPLFSVPLYHANVSGYINDVIDFDNLPLEEFSTATQYNSIVSINQNILTVDKFSNIRSIIESVMEEYVYDKLNISKNVKLKLICSWMLIGSPGSKTYRHSHTNSLFSGIFYIKSEKESGDIIFSADSSRMTFASPTINPNVENFNIYNSLNWKISPKTNDIIIFPSHLLHEVTENKSNTNRCAIAFNYFLTGNISDKITQVLEI